MKYIDADRLKAEIKRLKKHSEESKKEWISEGYNQHAFAEDCRIISFNKLLSLIDSLQQEQDSRSIPVLRADTTEKQDRILEIIGQDEIYCHFPLDFSKETDCGYEDYNDRVYIDGVLTFNEMAEIVDFLSKNSK